jgi:long-chain fatty acid transport protein
MRVIKRFVVAMTLTLPVSLFGQGYQVYLQGQVQQGMGGAGIGMAQDASTLFYNPGASSFVKHNSIQLGGSGVFSNAAFLESGTNAIYRTKSPAGTPFAAYGLFGIKDSSKLKLGLAVYTPFGSGIQWEDNWSGRFVLTQAKIMAVFIQPTVSYKFNDKLGIGAGFIYSTGGVNLQKDIPVSDSNGNYGHAELNGKASGFGFNVGLYIRPTEKFSIGLTYRSQVNMKVKEGDATFTVPSSLATNFPNTTFTASLPLPQIASLGLAYKVTDKLDLALDVNYGFWKVYDTLSFDYKDNTSSLEDTKSPRMYENALSIRLGGQYKITDKFQARLGIAFSQTPVQSDYVSPETPDGNRISYTAGLGYEITDHFGANVSFQFISYKRTESNNVETNLSGTYSNTILIPGISVHYNF